MLYLTKPHLIFDSSLSPITRNDPSSVESMAATHFTPLISERAVDQPRPIKVIYIGAGISGILAAIKFREAVPNLSLTIYEKNPDLGGTWYENKYPGCACGEQKRYSEKLRGRILTDRL